MVTKSFKSEFWRLINRNRPARDVMQKIPTKRHSRIVHLLEIVTDPYVEKRLKGAAAKINGEILRSLPRPDPSRKELRGLARRLLTINKDLNRMFGGDDLPFKKELFLTLAEDCRSRATDLKYMVMARSMSSAVTRTPYKMSFKAFWRHLLLAMLCREVDAPRSISFAEVEKLLHYAHLARGLDKRRPSRSVEREYKHFLQFKSSNLYSAVWPQVVQKVLDGALRVVLPATK